MNNEFCIFKNLKRQAFDLSFFFEISIHGFIDYIEENQAEREGNANFTSVSIYI